MYNDNCVSVSLTEEELNKCREFAVKCADTMNEKSFGATDNKKRTVAVIARDNLIGKMAEQAYYNFFRRSYGIEMPLDFRKLPRGQWDSEDMYFNGWRIDVKSTKDIGNWALLELNKFNFRSQEKKVADIYLFSKVEWDIPSDSPKSSRKVHLLGWAKLEDFIGDENGTRKAQFILRGDFLPDTSEPLKADNLGIRFTELNTDWDELARLMKNRSAYHVYEAEVRKRIQNIIIQDALNN